VRVLPEEREIVYPFIDGTAVSLTADVVACITDFGAAHAKLPFFLPRKHTQAAEDSPASEKVPKKRIADMEESEEEDADAEDDENEDFDEADYDSDVLETDDEVFEEPDDDEDEDYEAESEEEDEDEDDSAREVDEAQISEEEPEEPEEDEEEPYTKEGEDDEEDDEEEEEELTEGDAYSDDDPEEEENEVDEDEIVKRIERRTRRENAYHLRPDRMFVEAHPAIHALSYLNTSTIFYHRRVSPFAANSLHDVVHFLTSISTVPNAQHAYEVAEKWLAPLFDGPVPKGPALNDWHFRLTPFTRILDIEPREIIKTVNIESLTIREIANYQPRAAKTTPGDEDVARVAAESVLDRDTPLARLSWRDIPRRTAAEYAHAFAALA
jgi:hypothetical protein